MSTSTATVSRPCSSPSWNSLLPVAPLLRAMRLSRTRPPQELMPITRAFALVMGVEGPRSECNRTAAGVLFHDLSGHCHGSPAGAGRTPSEGVDHHDARSLVERARCLRRLCHLRPERRQWPRWSSPSSARWAASGTWWRTGGAPGWAKRESSGTPVVKALRTALLGRRRGGYNDHLYALIRQSPGEHFGRTVARVRCPVEPNGRGAV